MFRESEERVHLAAQAGKMYAYDWDVATDVIVRSPDASNVLGAQCGASLTRQELRARIHPDDRALFDASVSERTPEHPDVQISYRFLRPDGSVVCLEKTAHASFDEGGRLVRMIGMVTDITERKEAEEELRKSEERFRMAAQAGKMFAYEWDVATDIIVRSPEAAKILRIDEGGPIRGQQILAKVHPDDRERVTAAVSALCPAQPYLQISYRMIRGDGTTVWVERNSRAHFDAQGRMLRVVGMVADITERKQAEEALRVSEERLRLAQQAACIGSFERDVRTGRVTWAEGLESLYGLPSGSVLGKTTAFFNELIHPADRERTAHLIQQALKTGQPTEGEWRAIWPDGSVHWIASRWQALMDESGEPSRVVGVNLDITERKHAEEALVELNRTLEAQSALLQSSEELLKIFVKNVPAAVAMLDREMRYVQVSDRWCTDYLPGREQILGRSHYELFPDMPERWKEVHRRGLEGETLRADDDRWDGQDGPHWARWEVRPWKTADGTVGGILILAEDITRRKQMEEALSGMSRKLIEAQEQERARIARELHDDIGQRLALLSVELHQLQNKLANSPPDILNQMRDVGKQMEEISTDVHNLSHELHSSKIELLGVAGAMKSWCREFGSRQKMQIDFKSPDIRSLPQEISLCLFRVLQEAVNNADKHSGVKRIEVQLHTELGEIHLIVRDLGKGFDVAAVEQGKGLGLASMRERVRLINGTIAIESKPMAGTTIRVRIPFHSEESVQRAAG
jgi:PAS domain S-box-containing protein